MTTVVLNVKIDAELKEKLRHYAEVNNENLGTATEKLLQLAFQLEESAGEAGVTEEDIDSQHTGKRKQRHLPPKEIKALRNLKKKNETNKFLQPAIQAEACDMLRSGLMQTRPPELNTKTGVLRIASISVYQR